VTPPWAAVPVSPPELELADEDIDSDEPADDSDDGADDDSELVAIADELDGALLWLGVLELAVSLELLHAVVTRAMRPTAAAATVVLRRMETFPDGCRDWFDQVDGVRELVRRGRGCRADATPKTCVQEKFRACSVLPRGSCTARADVCWLSSPASVAAASPRSAPGRSR